MNETDAILQPMKTSNQEISGIYANFTPEIIIKILDYLPIPTDEILGHGDGGARKWKELQNLLFTIAPRAFDNKFLEQIETREFHKVIKLFHSTPESFVDCYNRPPFFPQKVEVIIEPEIIGQLTTLRSARNLIKWIRLRVGTLGLDCDPKISRNLPYNCKLSQVRIDCSASKNPYFDHYFESVSIEGVFEDINPMDDWFGRHDYHSCLPHQFMYAHLKTIQVETNNWEWVEGCLPPALESLILVDNGYGKDLSTFDTNISIKQLIIKSLRPVSTMKITSPKNLEELTVLGTVRQLEIDFPDTLKLLTIPEIGNVTPPDTLEELDFIPTSDISLDYLKNLKKLTIDAQDLDSTYVLDSLPPSIEELMVVGMVQIDLDFEELPNFWKLTIENIEIDTLFQDYVVDTPWDNSFTFKFENKTYSIPFTENFSSLTIVELTDIDEVVCFPSSLRFMEIISCSGPYLDKLPIGLKCLSLTLNYATGDVNLPPNLDVLHLNRVYLDKLVSGNVKHLIAYYTDLSELRCPEGLKTFSYVGNDTGVPNQEFWDDAQLTTLSLGIEKDPNGHLYESSDKPCLITLHKSLRLFESHCSPDIKLEIKNESNYAMLRRV